MTKRINLARDYQRCMGQIIKIRTFLEARATDSVDDIRKPYKMLDRVYKRNIRRLREQEEKYKMLSKERLTTFEDFFQK